MKEFIQTAVEVQIQAEALKGMDFSYHLPTAVSQQKFYELRNEHKKEQTEYAKLLGEQRDRGAKVKVWLKKQGHKIVKHPNFKKAVLFTSIAVAGGLILGGVIVATGGIGALPITGILAAGLGPALPVVLGVGAGFAVSSFFIEGRTGAVLQTISVALITVTAMLTIAPAAGAVGTSLIIGTVAAGVTLPLMYVFGWGREGHYLMDSFADWQENKDRQAREKAVLAKNFEIIGVQESQVQSRTLKARWKRWKDGYWTGRNTMTRVQGIMNIVSGGSRTMFVITAVAMFVSVPISGVLAGAGVAGLGAGLASTGISLVITVGFRAVPSLVIFPLVDKWKALIGDKVTQFDPVLARQNLQTTEQMTQVLNLMKLEKAGVDLKLLAQPPTTEALVAQLQSVYKDMSLDLYRSLSTQPVSQEMATRFGVSESQLHMMKHDVELTHFFTKGEGQALVAQNVQILQAMREGRLIHRQDFQNQFQNPEQKSYWKNLQMEVLDPIAGTQLAILKVPPRELSSELTVLKDHASQVQDWLIDRHEQQIQMMNRFETTVASSQGSFSEAVSQMNVEDLLLFNRVFALQNFGASYPAWNQVSNLRLKTWKHIAELADAPLEQRKYVFQDLKLRVEGAALSVWNQVSQGGFQNLSQKYIEMVQFDQETSTLVQEQLKLKSELADQKRELESLDKGLDAVQKLQDQGAKTVSHEGKEVAIGERIQDYQTQKQALQKKLSNLEQKIEEQQTLIGLRNAALWKTSGTRLHRDGLMQRRLDIAQLEQKLAGTQDPKQKQELEKRLEKEQKSYDRDRRAVQKVDGKLALEVLKDFQGLQSQAKAVADSGASPTPDTLGIQRLRDPAIVAKMQEVVPDLRIDPAQSWLQQMTQVTLSPEQSNQILGVLYQHLFKSSLLVDQGVRPQMAMQRMAVLRTLLLADHLDSLRAVPATWNKGHGDLFRQVQFEMLVQKFMPDADVTQVSSKDIQVALNMKESTLTIEQKQLKAEETRIHADMENLHRDIGESALTPQERVQLQDHKSRLTQIEGKLEYLQVQLREIQQGLQFLDYGRNESVLSMMKKVVTGSEDLPQFVQDMAKVTLQSRDIGQYLEVYHESLVNQKRYALIKKGLQHYKDQGRASLSLEAKEVRKGHWEITEEAKDLFMAEFMNPLGPLNTEDRLFVQAFVEAMVVLIQHSQYKGKNALVSRISSLEAGLDILMNGNKVITAGTGIGKSKTIVPLNMIGTALSTSTMGRVGVNTFADKDKMNKALEDQVNKDQQSFLEVLNQNERFQQALHNWKTSQGQVLAEGVPPVKMVKIDGDSLDMYANIWVQEIQGALAQGQSVTVFVDVSGLQSLSLSLQNVDQTVSSLGKTALAKELLYKPHSYLFDEIHSLATVSELIQKQGQDQTLNQSHRKIARAMRKFDQSILITYAWDMIKNYSKSSETREKTVVFRKEDGQAKELLMKVEGRELVLAVRSVGASQLDTQPIRINVTETRFLYEKLTEGGKERAAYKAGMEDIEIGLRHFLQTDGVQRGFIQIDSEGGYSFDQSFVATQAFSLSLRRLGTLSFAAANKLGNQSKAVVEFAHDKMATRGFRKYWQGLVVKVTAFLHRHTPYTGVGEVKQGLKMYASLMGENVGSNYTLLRSGAEVLGESLHRARFVPASEDVTQVKQSFSDPIKLAVMEVHKSRLARQHMTQDLKLEGQALDRRVVFYEQLRLKVLHPTWGEARIERTAQEFLQSIPDVKMKQDYLRKQLAFEFSTRRSDLLYTGQSLRSSAGNVMTLLRAVSSNIRGMTATPYQLFAPAIGLQADNKLDAVLKSFGHQPEYIQRFLNQVHGIFGEHQAQLAVQLQLYLQSQPYQELLQKAFQPGQGSLASGEYKSFMQEWTNGFQTYLSQNGRTDLAQAFQQLIFKLDAAPIQQTHLHQEAQLLAQLQQLSHDLDSASGRHLAPLRDAFKEYRRLLDEEQVIQATPDKESSGQTPQQRKEQEQAKKLAAQERSVVLKEHREILLKELQMLQKDGGMPRTRAEAEFLLETLTSTQVMVFADLKRGMDQQKAMAYQLQDLRMDLQAQLLQSQNVSSHRGLTIDYNSEEGLQLRVRKGNRTEVIEVPLEKGGPNLGANDFVEHLLTVIGTPVVDSSNKAYLNSLAVIERVLGVDMLAQIQQTHLHEVQVVTIKNQRFGWDVEALNQTARAQFIVSAGESTDLTSLSQAVGRRRDKSGFQEGFDERTVRLSLEDTFARQLQVSDSMQTGKNTVGQVDMEALVQKLITNENHAVQQARYREIDRVLRGVAREQLAMAIQDSRLKTHYAELKGLQKRLAKLDRQQQASRDLKSESSSALDALNDNLYQVRQQLKQILKKLTEIGAPDDIIYRFSQLIIESKGLVITGNPQADSFSINTPSLVERSNSLRLIVDWINRYVNPQKHLPQYVKGENSDFKVAAKHFKNKSEVLLTRNMEQSYNGTLAALGHQKPAGPVVGTWQRLVQGRSLKMSQAVKKNHNRTMSLWVSAMGQQLKTAGGRAAEEVRSIEEHSVQSDLVELQNVVSQNQVDMETGFKMLARAKNLTTPEAQLYLTARLIQQMAWHKPEHLHYHDLSRLVDSMTETMTHSKEERVAVRTFLLGLVDVRLTHPHMQEKIHAFQNLVQKPEIFKPEAQNHMMSVREMVQLFEGNHSVYPTYESYVNHLLHQYGQDSIISVWDRRNLYQDKADDISYDSVRTLLMMEADFLIHKPSALGVRTSVPVGVGRDLVRPELIAQAKPTARFFDMNSLEDAFLSLMITPEMDRAKAQNIVDHRGTHANLLKAYQEEQDILFETGAPDMASGILASQDQTQRDAWTKLHYYRERPPKVSVARTVGHSILGWMKRHKIGTVVSGVLVAAVIVGVILAAVIPGSQTWLAIVSGAGGAVLLVGVTGYVGYTGYRDRHAIGRGSPREKYEHYTKAAAQAYVFNHPDELARLKSLTESGKDKDLHLAVGSLRNWARDLGYQKWDRHVAEDVLQQMLELPDTRYRSDRLHHNDLYYKVGQDGLLHVMVDDVYALDQDQKIQFLKDFIVHSQGLVIHDDESHRKSLLNGETEDRKQLRYVKDYDGLRASFDTWDSFEDDWRAAEEQLRADDKLPSLMSSRDQRNELPAAYRHLMPFTPFKQGTIRPAWNVDQIPPEIARHVTVQKGLGGDSDHLVVDVAQLMGLKDDAEWDSWKKENQKLNRSNEGYGWDSRFVNLGSYQDYLKMLSSLAVLVRPTKDGTVGEAYPIARTARQILDQIHQSSQKQLERYYGDLLYDQDQPQRRLQVPDILTQDDVDHKMEQIEEMKRNVWEHHDSLEEALNKDLFSTLEPYTAQKDLLETPVGVLPNRWQDHMTQWFEPIESSAQLQSFVSHVVLVEEPDLWFIRDSKKDRWYLSRNVFEEMQQAFTQKDQDPQQWKKHQAYALMSGGRALAYHRITEQDLRDEYEDLQAMVQPFNTDFDQLSEQQLAILKEAFAYRKTGDFVHQYLDDAQMNQEELNECHEDLCQWIERQREGYLPHDLMLASRAAQNYFFSLNLGFDQHQKTVPQASFWKPFLEVFLHPDHLARTQELVQDLQVPELTSEYPVDQYVDADVGAMTLKDRWDWLQSVRTDESLVALRRYQIDRFFQKQYTIRERVQKTSIKLRSAVQYASFQNPDTSSRPSAYEEHIPEEQDQEREELSGEMVVDEWQRSGVDDLDVTDQDMVQDVEEFEVPLGESLYEATVLREGQETTTPREEQEVPEQENFDVSWGESLYEATTSREEQEVPAQEDLDESWGESLYEATALREGQREVALPESFDGPEYDTLNHFQRESVVQQDHGAIYGRLGGDTVYDQLQHFPPAGQELKRVHNNEGDYGRLGGDRTHDRVQAWSESVTDDDSLYSEVRETALNHAHVYDTVALDETTEMAGDAVTFAADTVTHDETLGAQAPMVEDEYDDVMVRPQDQTQQKRLHDLNQSSFPYENQNVDRNAAFMEDDEEPLYYEVDDADLDGHVYRQLEDFDRASSAVNHAFTPLYQRQQNVVGSEQSVVLEQQIVQQDHHALEFGDEVSSHRAHHMKKSLVRKSTGTELRDQKDYTSHQHFDAQAYRVRFQEMQRCCQNMVAYLDDFDLSYSSVQLSSESDYQASLQQVESLQEKVQGWIQQYLQLNTVPERGEQEQLEDQLDMLGIMPEEQEHFYQQLLFWQNSLDHYHHRLEKGYRYLIQQNLRQYFAQLETDLSGINALPMNSQGQHMMLKQTLAHTLAPVVSHVVQVPGETFQKFAQEIEGLPLDSAVKQGHIDTVYRLEWAVYKKLYDTQPEFMLNHLRQLPEYQPFLAWLEQHQCWPTESAVLKYLSRHQDTLQGHDLEFYHQLLEPQSLLRNHLRETVVTPGVLFPQEWLEEMLNDEDLQLELKLKSLQELSKHC